MDAVSWFILIWIGLCIAVGCLAMERNRTFLGYSLLSCIFTPVLIGLIVFCLPRYPHPR